MTPADVLLPPAGRDWAVQPPYLVPGYRSTALRAPSQRLVPIKHTLSELPGPVYGESSLGPLDQAFL